MMAMVWRVDMWPYMSADMCGGGGLGRMKHSSSSCSLATSRTSRRSGTKMSVIGMMHAPSSSISMPARPAPRPRLSPVKSLLAQASRHLPRLCRPPSLSLASPRSKIAATGSPCAP
uniref:Uncharacterized protein n=1 Tax=Triticum urartu TaxID=4572 RepID=A0A8R7TLA9_TRIUA